MCISNGYSGDPVHGCTCGIGQIQTYRQRLSGPLLDRIDMTLEVARLPVEKLAQDDDGPCGESSAEVKARVMAARRIQMERNLPVAKPSSAGVPACEGENTTVAAASLPPDSPGSPGTTPVPGRRHITITNASLTSRQVKTYCRLDEAGKALLTRAVERLGLSARAYERIRKVARTIADLEGSEHIGVPHLAEAIQYRSGEERLRG
jgi:magnesium chelatase family protein